jgi:TolB-like protein/DNA-binding winged helix-turn-helix (wHTH) protein/Flp pilus assembly protein TadD
MDHGQVYAFGAFRLDAALRRLERDGHGIPLSPKAFDILVALVERRHRVVEKAELMQLVWPASFVEEANLSQTIFVLRKTLGEQPDGRPFIETVPRRGYRFAADVGVSEQAVRPSPPVASEPPSPTFRWGRLILTAAALAAIIAVGLVAWRGATTAAPSIRSIAVLPLTNLSGQSSEDYFADGLTEALIADLAQVGSLRVVSRTSTLAYRKTAKPSAAVGRELGVDGFIEGSVVRAGERVRVTVQLIHAASDRNLWARNYERRLADVLDLQREIARTVADEISAALTPIERRRLERTAPADPRAHDAYLRGRFEFNKRTREGFLAAIRHFEEAIAVDAKLAAAYSGLADCYTLLAGFLHIAPRQAIPRAEAAAVKALQIDPDLPDAHVSLGYIRLRYDYDWPRAEAEFRRAIALNPNSELAHHWYALSLAWVGRFEDARAEIGRAGLVDPLSRAVLTSAGLVHYIARDYERAVAEFDRVLSMDPVNVVAFRRRGWAYQMLGRHESAIASFERAHQLSGGDIIETAALGRGYAMGGRRADALRFVDDLRTRDPGGDLTAYSLAEIHAALGDGPAALSWLERAYETRSIWFVWIRNEPVFDRLRSDPRFTTLVQRVQW